MLDRMKQARMLEMFCNGLDAFDECRPTHYTKAVIPVKYQTIPSMIPYSPASESCLFLSSLIGMNAQQFDVPQPAGKNVKFKL